MAIRTPRPPTRNDPTLISELINTFQQEQELQRVSGLEEEDRERRFAQEDLLTQGEEQRQRLAAQQGEIARRQDLRSRGFEESGGAFIPGTEGPSREDIAGALDPGEDIGLGRGPESPLQRQRPSIFGGQAEPGVRAGAVRGRGARQQAQEGRQRREGLEPAQAQGPQFTEPHVRRLEPPRDPSIVHPSLLPQPAPPEFDFASLETDFGFPEGTLSVAFRENANQALRLIIEKQKEQGEAGRVDVDSPRFKALVQVSEIELRNLQSQLNSISTGAGTFSIADEPRVVADIIDKMNDITRSLTQILIGADKPFDARMAAEVFMLLNPEATTEEIAEYVEAEQESQLEGRIESGVRETSPRVTAGRRFLNRR